MEPKPNPHGMQCLTSSNFRGGILALISLHNSATNFNLIVTRHLFAFITPYKLTNQSYFSSHIKLYSLKPAPEESGYHSEALQQDDLL